MDISCKMELVLQNVVLSTLLTLQPVNVGSLFFVNHSMGLIKLELAILLVPSELMLTSMLFVVIAVRKHAHPVLHWQTAYLAIQIQCNQAIIATATVTTKKS